jgi:hypothetical protein
MTPEGDNATRRRTDGDVGERPVGSTAHRRVVKKVVAKPAAPADQPLAPRRAPLRERWVPTWRPSLPRPDVRGRAADLRDALTDLRYAITDRLWEAADGLRGMVSNSRQRVHLWWAQLSSVQIVAIVGGLLLLLALFYGWGIYNALHPRNGNR